MKTALASTCMLGALIMGCQVEIDPNAFFPQDYETQMSLVGDCRVSSTHSDPYYKFYVTTSSKDAFVAGMPLPEGTVLLKAQYRDKTCEELNRWTVMKKREAGFDAANNDWEWQNIDPEGQIAEQGKLGYCASCHTPCPGSVCTK
ncbi:MAG TPA: cytochrome P460 family protein [Polyangium sp.]|jgi:hypothetical protein|nr:cytochrome P460 family protein [Polyangium sp.]